MEFSNAPSAPPAPTSPQRSSLSRNSVTRSAASSSAAPTHISITVRTLSGSSLSFEQLPVETTILALKKLIFAQNKNFPVNKQRLIVGSRTLEDDFTLEIYAFKSGDVIHLAMKLGGDADEGDEAGALGGDAPDVKISQGPSGQDANLLTVVVPANAPPGTRLLIHPPGREAMTVVVQPGLQEGQRFQVRLPPREGAAGAGASGAAASGAGGGAAAAAANQQLGQIMQVVCPPNGRPGQRILINVPGRSQFWVAVPDGVRPGQMFRFRLPPP